jgi:hypothetical protein
MDSRTRRLIRPMSVLLLGLLLAVTAGAVAFGSQGARPAAPAKPAAPTARPTPTATPAPTARPQATPVWVDRPHLFVDIVDGAGREITIEVADGYATLAKARPGVAGDGMSVPWGELAVAQLDARTLRLTWAGQSTEDHILSIDPVSKTLRLSRPAILDGDSIAFDRVLILEFVGPISADEYEAVILTGFDTQG